MKKIVVLGAGYVGLSISALLSRKHEVIISDINDHKVEKINNRISPIEDVKITEFFENERLHLKAVTNPKEHYKHADFIVIATPTNYDPAKDYFDCSSVESVLKDIKEHTDEEHMPTIVIKSTIPMGFTEAMIDKFGLKTLIFSPEFLREGKALEDNLYPSRVVVGTDVNHVRAENFASMMVEAALKEDVPVLITGIEEAEAIKLFANTYLAMRVAFMNELDSFAESHGLETGDIIKGISLDPRIGDYYNNPSFGYGGYCLPKDTKQLLANFKGVPQSLMAAIVESNKVRKDFITEQVLMKSKTRAKKEVPVIGVFRLTMKSGSDNFRESAIKDILENLKKQQAEILIYEPTLVDETSYEGYNLENDIVAFKEKADLIIANRVEDDLKDVEDKVYTRDVFKRD